MASSNNSVAFQSENNLIKVLIKQLSSVLTGGEEYSAPFRVHNKQLQTLGELSFPISLDFAAWRALKVGENVENCTNIFEYASKIHNSEINEHTLPLFNNNYPGCIVPITHCKIIKANCHLFLNRTRFTQLILYKIINCEQYGAHQLYNILIKHSECNSTNLSALRVEILKKILENFISVNNDELNENNEIEILLTLRSSDKHANKILCGCIVNDNGQKEEAITSDDLFAEYASNMRMMFEHKYGVRKIADNSNWKATVRKLGHAAVTFHMIQNTPQKTVSLASKHHVIKDAAFVVYNNARIKSILQRFEGDVASKTRAALPPLELVDVDSLKLNEEWELVYGCLAQFPRVVENAVCELHACKLAIHKLYEFLVQFATTFSTYYSRIKIITEPMKHLFATMHARIYLLKSIEVVLNNALRLLNIESVQQM